MAAYGAVKALPLGSSARVTVLEKMPRPGRKILFTGKGRCNFTNLKDWNEFSQHIRTNPNFVKPAFYNFTPENTIDFLERNGLETVVERGDRAFPYSHRASDVLDTIVEVVLRHGVTLLTDREVTDILPGFSIRCADGETFECSKLIIATGGLSYPGTGSTGDGYKLAEQAGHTIVEPVPSLVSLVSHDPDCKKMMGLALKNVTLTLFEDNKAIFDEQGEMLFTHFGISGPLTLSASSHLGDMKKHRYHAEIDLKPALSEEQLYDRITRDFALLANHAAQGALVKLLPASMQPVMVARWGIDPATKANQITREQKRELVQLMKHWRVSIDARGDLAHAVITSGGVSVREVDPKTMQSKKALGLYFAGEVLDVDAYTGGYNLQIAFCTAQSFANNL